MEKIEADYVIEAVIYDLDGTLLDSKKLRIRAWKHAFKVHGIDLDESEIDPLIGLPGPDLAGRFSPRAFEIEQEEERFFRQNLEKLELYGDAVSTVNNLKSAGIKTGVVTSSRRAMVDILKLPFEPVVTIDDVEVGKPDPEAYLRILGILGVNPKNAMFVGDAETDLIPARELGSVSVHIGHGRRSTSKYADYYVNEIWETEKLAIKINNSQGVA